MAMITQDDLTLILQQSAAPQTAKLKIEVLDSNKKLVDTLYGAVSGSMSINSQSDIRRTANFVIQPTLTNRLRLSEDSLLWLNKDIRLFLGLYQIRTGDYKYYPLGYYVYTNTSGTYNATTNQLTINCADFMKKLDGTKNGQLGDDIIKISVSVTDPITGETLYNTIRDSMVTSLETLAHITNHRIDEIAPFKALPEYNDNWEAYRAENEDWNRIPYDLEFSRGCSVLSILTSLRDLYSNYEMFFDPEDNTFICQRVPSCYEDDIWLDNTFIQKILISENTSVDMARVRNICEVWGPVFDPDYTTDTCTYSSGIYQCSITGFEEKYHNGDVIAIKIPSSNTLAPKLNVNQLGDIPIYQESTDTPLTAGSLVAGKRYCFRIKKYRDKGEDILKAYLLGEYQIHVLDVLTDGRKDTKTYITSDGKELELYSQEYFKHVYNCENVNMTIIANSPFTVQKLGEIPDVKTGNDYDNITSNDLALERAVWENKNNCRLTDNITITTLLMPFLDVNKKISYRPSDCEKERQYIITSVNHDFSSFTSTITMYRFYPSYEILIREAGTHKVLSEYSHGVLSKYTHEQLTTFISGEEL